MYILAIKTIRIFFSGAIRLKRHHYSNCDMHFF